MSQPQVGPTARDVVRIVAMAVIVAGVAACTSSPNGMPEARERFSNSAGSGTDRVPTAAAVAILNAEGRVNEVWPGWWPSSQAFAILLRKQTLLGWPDTGSRPSAPWQQIATEGAGGRLFLLDSAIGEPGLPFQTVDVDGRALTAVVVPEPRLFWTNGQPTVPWMGDSVAVLIMFLFHEHFHAYQQRAFRPLGGQSSVFANESEPGLDSARLADATVQAGLRAERAMLRSALDQDDRDMRLKILRQYYSARQSRYDRLPRAFAIYEASQERAEGIALFVGYGGVAAVLRLERGDRTSLIRGLLDLPWDGVRSTVPPSLWAEYRGWHLYAVGAAKALLLEESRRGWMDEVERGASLDSLLEPLTR